MRPGPLRRTVRHGRIPATLLALAVAVSLSTLRTPASTQARADRPPALTRIQDEFDAMLAQPALDRATWGIVVRSLTSGEALYSLNARKLLVPASNMKVVTLAAAAERLGWDYTFETRLVAAGAVESGVLEGDLVVVGSGDPSIDDWEGGATVLFEAWADALAAKGIHTIRGRVIGDDNAFDDDALGAGWAWDDLDRSYATGVSALQFNQNTAQVTVRAGTEAGLPARVALRPESAGLTVRHRLVTSGGNTQPSVITRRAAGSTTLEMRGVVPARGRPIVRNVSVPNPTMYFATALRDVLRRSGIDIHGSAVDIDDLESPPVPGAGVTLVVHRSPALAELAVTMMRASQNLYAETFLKALGVRPAADGDTTGHDVAMTVLQAWGLAASDVVIADGSGLSRYNLATADALAGILSHVHGDARLRQPFVASLPIAGREGTLASRMDGTPAEGNARAKTGAMGNVRSLSGYVATAEGEPLVFAMLVNNFGTTPDIVERTMDAMVVKLAEFSRRETGRQLKP